jgi:glycosyltransferase involved in cell wall biosynthesis
MKPRVSVVIPAYNAGRFIVESINSVIRQSYKDWELFIINNASTDNTPDLIASVCEGLRDPRIRVLHNPVTLPALESWNPVLLNTEGDYIKLICADDIPTLDCIERQASILNANPTVVLTTGARSMMNSRGTHLFTRNSINKAGLYEGRQIIRKCILSGSNIIGDPVNVMWRRSAMDKVGPFDPSTASASDLEFWLRLLSVGDLYYDRCVTGHYRIHGSSYSAEQQMKTVQGFLKIVKLQIESGRLELSGTDLLLVKAKAYLQGYARKLIYKYLSQG